MNLDIEKFDPCDDGLDWYNQQKSSVEAWNSCKRGDWMLWIAIELGVDKKKIILAAAKCANTVRHLMKDERNTNAVDIAIAYGEGIATKEELEEANKKTLETIIGMSAYAAISNAYWAAYHATDAARVAADADAAYDAAYYAGAASYYAAGESQEAREANQLQTANICREILTDDIIEIIEIIEKH